MVLRFLIICALLVLTLSSNLFAEEPLLGFFAFTEMRFIDAIAGSSFKFLLPYGTDGKNDILLNGYLNYAESKGVNIIFSLKDCYKKSKWYPKIDWCPLDNEANLASCIVNKFDRHGAVYGWYLADEPTDSLGIWSKNLLKKNSKAIRQQSNKLIFVEDHFPPRGKLWDDLNTLADILLTGSYPVPDKKIDEVYYGIKGLTAKYRKPVIAVIQIHGKYQYPFFNKSGEAGRVPTPDEIRVMSYLSLMAGAKGIMYYSLFDLMKQPDADNRIDFMKQLASEIKKDYEIISSNISPQINYTLKADAGVLYTFKRFNNRDYYFLINTENQSKKVIAGNKKGSVKAGYEILMAPLAVKIVPAEL